MLRPAVSPAEETNGAHGAGTAEWPTVTIVFLVFNRREELRESLQRMLHESDYPSDRVDVIVVDNASTDDSAAMVREEFPQVQLIVRDVNVGVSGWNEGLAAARGDYVLALDDDCYLAPDGLRRSVAAALDHDADLVSYKVISTVDPGRVFSEDYRTGLFMFWGCAALMRRTVVEALGGYDPQIFVWANELEFMLRFFDNGFRHLHLPEVVAHHMKAVEDTGTWIEERTYRVNARHWAYIAAKRLKMRDAAEAFLALLLQAARDGYRVDRVAYWGILETIKGFARGLRHRDPISSAEVSRFFRRHFHSYVGPFVMSRPIGQLMRDLPRELIRGHDPPRPKGQADEFWEERAALYPQQAATLKF
jgi:GT2 family glycosyltransferase